MKSLNENGRDGQLSEIKKMIKKLSEGQTNSTDTIQNKIKKF